VAAKSGGLLGQVRHEIGVIAYPDGDVLSLSFSRRQQAERTPRSMRPSAGPRRGPSVRRPRPEAR
jgi:hypothetical protein